MSSYYSDPTANRAIGAVDKQIARMRKKAQRLQQIRLQRGLNPAMEAEARRIFVGIYRPLLAVALWEIPEPQPEKV